MLENLADSDALSFLLDRVTLRCTHARWSSVTASSGITVPAGAVTLYLVERGDLTVQIADGGSPLRLGEGDMALLSDGSLHDLATDADSATLDEAEQFNHRRHAHLHGADEGCAFIRARYDIGVGAWNVLESVLPAVFHYRARDHHVANVAGLQRLCIVEAKNDGPGAAAILHRYAELLLFDLLRMALADKIGQRQPYLGGLLDPDIGPVLHSIHGQPDRAWSVASLAREASMSRSTFAARFRNVVGTAPLEYLTEYRIKCAQELLQNTSLGIKQVAKRSGYKSPSAFSSAFKRRTGVAPADFRAQSDAA